MTEKKSIFLALPQGQFVHPGSVKGAFRASRRHRVQINEQPCSILTFGFNLLLASALNMRRSLGLTHFAMLHADIEPEPESALGVGWLDTLLDELDAHQADLVSAIVPIKNDSGILSMGVEQPGDPFTAAFRLTLKQAYSLPETFSAADCGYPDRALLVNSGCWVMRFDQPWVEQLCFTMQDRIEKGPDGVFRASVEPEDWRLSRDLHRMGRKVMATRKVAVAHHGHAAYPNFPAWGQDRDVAGSGQIK